MGVCQPLSELGPEWEPPQVQPSSAPSLAVALSGHFRSLGHPLVHRALKANLIDAFGGDTSVFMGLKFEEIGWAANTRAMEQQISTPGAVHHNIFTPRTVKVPTKGLAKAVKWLRPRRVHIIPDDSRPPAGCGLHKSRLYPQARGIAQAIQLIREDEQRRGRLYDYWIRTRPDLLWVRRFPRFTYFAGDPMPGPTYLVHDLFEFMRGALGRQYVLHRFEETAQKFGQCAQVTHEQVTTGHICLKCVEARVAGCSFFFPSWMTSPVCSHTGALQCTNRKKNWLFSPWECMHPIAMIRELRPLGMTDGDGELSPEGFWGCYGVPVCNLNFTDPVNVDRQVAAWNKLEMCGPCAKVWMNWRRTQGGFVCNDHTMPDGKRVRHDPTEKCEREAVGDWKGPLGCTYDRCDASRWHMFKPKREWPKSIDGRKWNEPG